MSKCMSTLKLDLGVLGTHECTVHFNYVPEYPAGFDDPGSDEEFEVEQIILRGVDIMLLCDKEIMHDDVVEQIIANKGSDYDGE